MKFALTLTPIALILAVSAAAEPGDSIDNDRGSNRSSRTAGVPIQPATTAAAPLEVPRLSCAEADRFESSQGPACKIFRSVIPIDVTVKPQGLIELPTAIVVGVMSIVTGYAVIGEAYEREGMNKYNLKVSAPKTFDDYLFCKARVVEWSVNDVADRRWDHLDDRSGTLHWRIDEDGFTGGRRWYKANIYWVVAHPEYREAARANGECAPTVSASSAPIVNDHQTPPPDNLAI